jgi:hypothetical protein
MFSFAQTLIYMLSQWLLFNMLFLDLYTECLTSFASESLPQRDNASQIWFLSENN